MYIYTTLVVLQIAGNYIKCESTSDVPKEVQQKSSTKSSPKDLPLITDTLLKQSLKPYQPTSDQDAQVDISIPRIYRPSSHVTKLAKTLSLNFDPSFSKVYFEPFERRPRPLTLVAFRRNGLMPKHVIKDDEKMKSLEVAVLQSPYNSVGYFWQDEPGEPEN